MADTTLPNSVRYIKNGAGGQWWKAAKENAQIHAGWSNVSADQLRAADMGQTANLIREACSSSTQEFNALKTLLDWPSHHIWITFQDGFMWWCTVKDGIEINPNGESKVAGHFWLNCASPWSNHSLGNKNLLSKSKLPGIVTTTEGYQGTLCIPRGAPEILRIILNEEDAEASAASQARQCYEDAVGKLIARLGPKDFEILVDLILSRTGWARLDRLGGATEGVDIEVENIATEEIAFVQVKSTATQATLDDYVSRFGARRERYHRMMFVVHSPDGTLTPPVGRHIAVWTRKDISSRVVKLGLGDWVAARL